LLFSPRPGAISGQSKIRKNFVYLLFCFFTVACALFNRILNCCFGVMFAALYPKNHPAIEHTLSGEKPKVRVNVLGSIQVINSTSPESNFYSLVIWEESQ
jgi:hypothetical protein